MTENQLQAKSTRAGLNGLAPYRRENCGSACTNDSPHRPMKFNLLLLSSTLVLDGCSSPDHDKAHPPNSPQPPVAQQIPKVQIIHGERLVDNYFWLREKTNPAVTAYLRAENAYTDAVMKPRQPLEHVIYKELLSHIKETDIQV